KDYLHSHPADRLMDRVLAPSLVLVRRGRRRKELRPDDEQFILQTTRGLVEELGVGFSAQKGAPSEAGRPVVLGIPARDEVDATALVMLEQLLRAEGQEVLLVDDGGLTAGLMARLHQHRPALVVILALGAGGLPQTRYLCRRLRAQFPSLPLMVG